MPPTKVASSPTGLDDSVPLSWLILDMKVSVGSYISVPLSWLILDAWAYASLDILVPLSLLIRRGLLWVWIA